MLAVGLRQTLCDSLQATSPMLLTRYTTAWPQRS